MSFAHPPQPSGRTTADYRRRILATLVAQRIASPNFPGMTPSEAHASLGTCPFDLSFMRPALAFLINADQVSCQPRRWSDNEDDVEYVATAQGVRLVLGAL